MPNLKFPKFTSYFYQKTYSEFTNKPAYVRLTKQFLKENHNQRTTGKIQLVR